MHSTVYRIQLFIQMTHISHNRSEVWIDSIGYTELFSKICVFFSNDKIREYCVRTATEGDVRSEVRGCSRGMNKIAQWRPAWLVLVTEFWWVWTEIQGDRWGKRNELEKLKMHTKISVPKSLRGRLNLGALDLCRMLKTTW